MAFIAPKNLAHAVALMVATGYNDGNAPVGDEQAEIYANAEAIVAQQQEAASAAEKAFKLTDEGKRKVRVALLAGKARLMALALTDKLAGEPPQTEQARKGTRIRGMTPGEVARDLRSALEACGIDAGSFRPAEGKPTKSAPAAVVVLNQLGSLLKVQALAAQPKTLAAKAG